MNLKTRFPYASEAFYGLNIHIPYDQTGSPLQSTFPQPTPPNALDKTSKGKTKSGRRITVSYRIFRVRPQDTDNSYASTKQITDALVLGGLLPGDDPTQIKTIVEQERCQHLTEERIELKITYP